MPTPEPAKKIKIKCPQCEKTIRAPLKMAGKSAKCPGCGAPIKIPNLPTKGGTSKKPSPAGSNKRASATAPTPAIKPKAPSAPVSADAAAAPPAPKPAPQPNAPDLFSAIDTTSSPATASSAAAATPSPAVPIAPTVAQTASAFETTPPDSVSDSEAAGGGKRFNLWAQVVCFLLFCVALLLFGTLNNATPRRLPKEKFSEDGISTLLFFAGMGICFGAIAWGSIWFVFHRATLWKRVVGITAVMAVVIAALLGGIMISGGAGPISVEDATSGSYAIPMLFFAFQLPLWIFYAFKHRLVWNNEMTDNTQPFLNIPNIAAPVCLVILICFLAFLAGFPGPKTAIRWPDTIAKFVGLGLLAGCPAVLVAWKVKQGWLAWLLAIAHSVVIVIAGYQILANEWGRRTPTFEICVSFGAFMAAVYLPIMLARIFGYRLQNPQKIENTPAIEELVS